MVDLGDAIEFRAVHQLLTHCGVYLVKLVREDGKPALSEERIDELEQNQMRVNQAVARQEIRAAQDPGVPDDDSDEQID